tara:strand:+ start:521 stop:760 length:240 start_codon:yes stop_codon:yes gene_type:complete
MYIHENTKENTKENIKENIKENFCGACVTVPVAIIGSSMGVSSSNKKKSNKTFICICIIFTIISIIIAIYYLKTCNECR